MVVDLPEELAQAIEQHASARGLPVATYVRQLLERDLKNGDAAPVGRGYGILARYGPAPTADEIDQNRAEMFPNFAERYG